MDNNNINNVTTNQQDEHAKLEKFKGRIIKVNKYADQTNVLIQGIKQRNQGYFDMSNRHAGSNGTYIEFGEYHGMKLDIKFCLYDTDKKLLDIQGKKFRLSPYITVDIYNEIMNLWGVQRMSPQRLESVKKYRGKKVNLYFTVIEHTLEMLNNDTASVMILCAMPFSAEGKSIIVPTRVYMELVK